MPKAGQAAGPCSGERLAVRRVDGARELRARDERQIAAHRLGTHGRIDAGESAEVDTGHVAEPVALRVLVVAVGAAQVILLPPDDDLARPGQADDPVRAI